MYTVIKNVQIIISLLKEYNIQHLVLSPGSRNVPFVHSVEHDPFFKCYSIVDERSAAYFALGLAEELDLPVLLSCTSSTACSNYFPAIKEAYERKIPLIALTADRDPRYREQMENQMIMQPHMYGRYCKKSVDLPTVIDDLDAAYCERLVNEALLELNHHGKGPVQINFPAFTNFHDFSVRKLPKCRVISRIDNSSTDVEWEQKINELKQYNKIMLLFGEGNIHTENYLNLINKVFEKYNCMISVEHMSNIHSNGALRTFMVTESMSDDEMLEVLPDVIITFGANFASDFKGKLRNYRKCIRHWRVSHDGNVVDTFMALDTIFECSDEEFFHKLLRYAEKEMYNNLMYYNLWNDKISSIKFPDLEFSNFYVIGEFLKQIQCNSILHLSILNSIRLAQFFDIDKSIKVFANLGAYGIDGSLSTFLGQAFQSQELSYLVVGDLSFLYDISASLMPAMQNSNIRILLINNHGGGEFHYVYGNTGFQDINLHISAGHNINTSCWFSSLPVKYMCAKSKEELSNALKEFNDKSSDRPIVLEVITNSKKDGDILNKFYRMNRHIKKSTIIKKIPKTIIKKGIYYVKKVFK